MPCCDEVENPVVLPDKASSQISVPTTNLSGEGSAIPAGDHALLAMILPKGYPAEVEQDGTLRYTNWNHAEPPGRIEGFQQQKDLLSYKPLWDSCPKRNLKFVIKPSCQCLDIIATCFCYQSGHFMEEVKLRDCENCSRAFA